MQRLVLGLATRQSGLANCALLQALGSLKSSDLTAGARSPVEAAGAQQQGVCAFASQSSGGTSSTDTDHNLANRVYKNLPPRIILIRHAESGNLDDAVPNHVVPLTDTGRAQAEAAAAKVMDIAESGTPSPTFHIYTSPFLRASQTAETLSQTLGEVVECKCGHVLVPSCACTKCTSCI